MKLSRKLMMVSGGDSNLPDFLELVGTPRTATEGSSSSSSTFTIPLPAHQAGDLLVVTYQLSRAGGQTTGFGSNPDGWTQMVNRQYSGEGNAARMHYKIANSSAETFVVSPTVNEASLAGMGFVFRSKTGRVPQIEVVDSGTGNTYPALTPSAGVQKYSFLLGWFGKRNNTAVNVPTFPSGYSIVATNGVGTTSRYICSAMGYRNLETDTAPAPGTVNSSPGSSYTVYIAAVVWEE